MTIRAADSLLHTSAPPDARGHAVDLLLALAAVECHAGPGGRASMLPPLLRDLVIIATRLIGRSWLEANAETAAPFTALQTTVQPPPLTELDCIVSRVLAERYGLQLPVGASASAGVNPVS